MAAAPHVTTARSRTSERERPTASGIAAAMAATSPGITSRPHFRSSTSGIPPRANATTGVPHDSASATTRQYGSSHNGVASAAAAPPTTAANSS